MATKCNRIAGYMSGVANKRSAVVFGTRASHPSRWWHLKKARRIDKVDSCAMPTTPQNNPSNPTSRELGAA